MLHADPKQFEVKVELHLGPTVIEKSAPTVFEALTDFPIRWMDVMLHGTFRIYRNGKMYEKWMKLRLVRDVLRNPVRRKWWARIFEENLNFLDKK